MKRGKKSITRRCALGDYKFSLARVSLFVFVCPPGCMSLCFEFLLFMSLFCGRSVCCGGPYCVPPCFALLCRVSSDVLRGLSCVELLRGVMLGERAGRRLTGNGKMDD